jgi:hypothetical protein
MAPSVTLKVSSRSTRPQSLSIDFNGLMTSSPKKTDQETPYQH